MLNSLQPHGLEHTRLPSPSLSPRVCSNSCPLSQWCHPTISSSVIPFSSCLQSFSASVSFPLFQWVTSLHEVAKVLELQLQHQSFSEYSGLISFRIDWFDLLQSKGLSRVFSSTTVWKHHSMLSFLYCPTLTFICNYWKNHSFDYMDLCRQCDVSAF